MKSFVRGALGLWLTLWLSACGDNGNHGTSSGETAGFAGLGQTADEFAQARPGMTLERFEAIVARQMPDEEKRRRADFIVESDKGFETAREQVRRIVATVRDPAWMGRSA